MQWQQHEFRNFLCLFWIRVQPGGEHSAWHMLQRAGKALTASCSSPRDNPAPRTPEKGVSGCTSPTPPVPCERTELSKPRCCGTHEASPAMVSHRQIKSTWDDGGTVRSRNTLLQDAPSSGNCRRAGCVQLEPAYCSKPGVPGRSSQCSPSSAAARQSHCSLQDRLALGRRYEIPLPGCAQRFGGLQLATSRASPLLASPTWTSPRLSSSYFASTYLLCSRNVAKFGCYVIHSNAKFVKRPHPVFQFLSDHWDLYCTKKSKGRVPPTATYYTLWISFRYEKYSLFQKATFHLLPHSYWFHRPKQ